MFCKRSTLRPSQIQTTVLGGLLLSCIIIITLYSISLQVRPEPDVGRRPHLAPGRYRPCNDSLARQYHALRPRDMSPRAEDFRRRGWLMLAAVVSALERLHVPHWLSSGTLLGYVRQCELDPAMLDIDVEVDAGAFSEGGVTITQLVKAVTASGTGLRLLFKNGLQNESCNIGFKDDFGTKLELYLSYAEPDGSRYIEAIYANTLQRLRWTSPRVDVCWGTLDGLVLGVPCDASLYLANIYGPNWTLPLPTSRVWHWMTSAANVHKNGFYPKDMKNEVIHDF